MVRARATVAVLLAALAVYFVLIGVRGISLLGERQWSLKAFGVAVLALPLVGVWVVVAEVRFGRAAQRLTDELGSAGADRAVDVPRRPSGRIDRAGADALFAVQRAEVQADPADWRRWYRLAEAYDLAGDRRRAREAMRTAIERHDSNAA
ncbi:MAG: hypothetical protein ABJA87_00635 [bacterium]